MFEQQVIWIAPRATAFTVVCDACLASCESAESYLHATVSGSLRLEATHGSFTCPRGHDIRIERAHPAFAEVIR
jgi:hypothetical protein